MGGFNPPFFVEIQGLDTSRTVRPVIHDFQVSPSYFETMRVRILRGRGFDEFDRAGSEPVAIVSEAAVRTFWSGRDPVGSRLRLGSDLPWMTVVGVASDVVHRRLSEPAQPILYRSLEQSSDLSLALLIRTRGATSDLGERIGREVRAVDPDVPVHSVAIMADVIGSALAQRQFLMRLLAAFGALAAALALVGIYGVMAYSVSQQTREIGIRMAIGARQRDMSVMVIRRGLALTAGGLIVGSIASLGLSQVIRSHLFAVEPSDPVTLVIVMLLMTLAATAAGYLPARRAARVDPVVALRSQ
jgi:putative ABC transport system permease protein